MEERQFRQRAKNAKLHLAGKGDLLHTMVVEENCFVESQAWAWEEKLEKWRLGLDRQGLDWDKDPGVEKG